VIEKSGFPLQGESSLTRRERGGIKNTAAQFTITIKGGRAMIQRGNLLLVRRRGKILGLFFVKPPGKGKHGRKVARARLNPICNEKRRIVLFSIFSTRGRESDPQEKTSLLGRTKFGKEKRGVGLLQQPPPGRRPDATRSGEENGIGGPTSSSLKKKGTPKATPRSPAHLEIRILWRCQPKTRPGIRERRCASFSSNRGEKGTDGHHLQTYCVLETEGN